MVSDEFENPLDLMPIANGTNKYAPPEKMKELESNPRPEEEIADWFDESDHIEHEKKVEEIVTMHEKAYRLARAKYNPFAVGGSESIHDFQGGSENASSI